MRAAAELVRPLAWGAELVGPDEARFRLWAPDLEHLDLELNGDSLPMVRDDEGWFELVVDGVEAGAAYRYRLPDGTKVSDPAARAQLGDVHGPSLLVDPASYRWRNGAWRGRPWEEAVIYELHVGTFTEQGTFAAARDRLADLADLGVTAIELMPVAQFSGNRGWGYDGVLLYAPHTAYGTPDDLKSLIDGAHERSLMVLLDVVYNHFGPDGNYLNLYASPFFHHRRRTPWGEAIAYERAPVRRFFIENALYWLDEYRVDGLRLDAIDNIVDDRSRTELPMELARRIRKTFPHRHIHLTTEDNRNITRLHGRGPDGGTSLYTAEWNDDVHNAAHVIATGETDGYYADFAQDPWGKFARALAEGFAYQGERSPYLDNTARGEPSAHLPPQAFVDFLQNHDQVGNRACGERLTVLANPRTLELLQGILILSPHVPLLFMGEEYGEKHPFLFFTDFHGRLAAAVREGRRAEFARFPAFADDPGRVPDPNARRTFEASRLDWQARDSTEGRRLRERTGSLLEKRRAHVVPMLAGTRGHAGAVRTAGRGIVAVDWRLAGGRLSLRANLGATAADLPPAPGEVVHADPAGSARAMQDGRLPAGALLVSRQTSRGAPEQASRWQVEK